jgi:hypothetical protein
MKICVTLVGVCRPSLQQVKQNIERNISFFTAMPHTFSFLVVTYRNSFSEELLEFCKSIGVSCHILEPVTEFIFPVKISNPNVYRMFYSLNKAMDFVGPRDTSDMVIRVRLDAEVIQFELHELDENTFYVHKESQTSCGDNLAYGSYKVMKNVYKHENCLLKGMGTEEVVYSAVKKYGYRTKEFNFHYRLYQSSDAMCDGVPQWSRRNREWIYDGKYTMRDV